MPIPTPPAPPAPEPEPIVEKAVPEAVVAPVAVQQPPPPASPAAQKVLNMGRWDTGGGDDTDNIDFGFGSFGAVASTDAKTSDIVQQVVTKEPTLSNTTPGTSVSPARPPPGLSIGGMPPMPASAVMVHELENKLEGASLNAKKTTTAEPPAPSTQTPQPMTTMGQNALPSGLTQQNYTQQQLHQQQVMPGMYNYNAAGGGFVGGMQPVLAGMPQQQPGKPLGGQTGPQGSLPQQGLYGNQAPPSSATGNSSRADSSTTETTTGATAAAPTTAGVPPGMPSTIPYANPALHYGAQHAAAAQHQFYAMGGHQQQGIGYNYGYAGHQQFGGAVQGGFGYPQVMGQSGGYGASHYDDQGHQGNSHHSASGGYQNKSGGGGGGYRGRNAHSNNQYQNQYNPQTHGGYGGQPYGMGYHGHAQGGMTDPYAAMQQHQQHGGIHSGGVGGFQDDDHQKGRKGRGGNNSSLQQQFQQQGGSPHLAGQGQSFGLQGQQQQQVGGIESAPSSGGWSNQGAGGGWSGSAAQSGGWQGS